MLFLSVKGSALIIEGHSALESSGYNEEQNFLGIFSVADVTVSSCRLSSFPVDDDSISCTSSRNFSIQRWRILSPACSLKEIK